MRAESSATMVRLTAALAHELSSPLGALSSGIDTLLSLGRARAGGAGDQPADRCTAQADLSRSLAGFAGAAAQDREPDPAPDQPGRGLDAAGQSERTGQRSGGADQAAAARPALTSIWICSPFRTSPAVRSGCFRCCAACLSNSVQALHGEGRITVSTTLRDSTLELKIADNGRGIPAEQMAHIFDPRFQVADGRVSTGNWSLFTSRQYMKEHSGDIRIQSMEGKGTTVCLTLPSTS